jgi:hypothetical protein
VRRIARLRQDKGHRTEWARFIAHLTAQAQAPIGFDEVIVSTRATLAAKRSLRTGEPVTLQTFIGE